MSFDYDDNLSSKKRKNRNPIHLTNLLIIIGFIGLAVMFGFFMNNSDPASSGYSSADVEATVGARLSTYTASQHNDQSPQKALGIVTTHAPTAIPPTVEPRPIIEGTNITSGGVIEGEITDDVFEIHYTYEGQADTPIIITMQGVGLSEPAVILTNPYGNRIIASATAEQQIGDEDTHVISAVLPVDGQYIITATRNDGRAGDAEGDFQLILDIPESLKANARVTGIATGNGWQWYTIKNDEAFSINYTQDSTTFQPEVGVYRLDTQSQLTGIAYLFGEDITYGTLGRFEPDTRYFIAIGQPTLPYLVKETDETSQYTLGIQIAR